MSGRIIDLAQHSRQQSTGRANGHLADPLVPTIDLRRWDVDAAVLLSTGRYDRPTTASCGWVIDLQPAQRVCDVAVCRELWQHSVILRATNPAVYRYIHHLLCASFGVPA